MQALIAGKADARAEVGANEAGREELGACGSRTWFLWGFGCCLGWVGGFLQGVFEVNGVLEASRLEPLNQRKTLMTGQLSAFCHREEDHPL